MLNRNSEIWKNVEGYEGLYQVSNQGRVRSIDRVVPNGQNSTRLAKGGIKATLPSATSDYLYVRLYKNNIQGFFSVHRLVAEAFLENLESKPEVNHKDGNKLNNCLDNLEWVTSSENKLHAYKSGLRTGEAHAKRMVGTKYNSVSKYHNVSFDRIRNKWIGGIKHKKKMVEKQKRFNTEIEAAEYVNYLIDKYNLDRPKNIIS